MSVKILEKMLGGEMRLKLIKLFVFSGDDCFVKEDLISRIKIDQESLKKETFFLINFVNPFINIIFLFYLSFFIFFFLKKNKT
jgi:hypothetical protein